MDLIQFTDPVSNALRLDISAMVRSIEFEPPPLTLAASETFFVETIYVSQAHYGLRRISIELKTSGTSHDNLMANYQAIISQVQMLSSLHFRLQNASSANSMYFDLVPSRAWFHYDRFWTRANLLPTMLELDAQPYARGAATIPVYTSTTG